jgi:hypothetical protein
MTITVNGPNGVVINFPDGTDNATIDKAMRQAAGVGDQPKGFVENAADFFKSIPRGIVSGLTSAPNPSMVPGLEQEAEAVAPTRERATQALQAPLPAPQGPWGQAGVAVGEGVGNPYSYMGPGGIGLKVGGAVASSLGAEAGRKAAEGTVFEKPAQIGGAVLGGTAAFKALGPTKPKAAIPTSQELLDVGSSGYNRARQAGLDLNPATVMAPWGGRVEQELAERFTGGTHGTAPRTFAALRELQAPPTAEGARTVFTANNIQALRNTLTDIAAEVKPSKGGAFVPTSDAAAASHALQRLNDLVESLPTVNYSASRDVVPRVPGTPDPTNPILGGNPQEYVRETKLANANYGAGARLRDYDARLNKAELTADRQIAGSLDAQIKSKAGRLLENDTLMRGLNPAERKQLKLINSGNLVSNTLRQAGRGHGVLPLTASLATASVTGGAYLPWQLALAGGAYGSRLTSELMTRHRASKLAEMLAKRSPLYEERVRNLPPADTTTGTAAIIRALLNAQ